MKLTNYIVVISLMCSCPFGLTAQILGKKKIADTTSVVLDTLPQLQDSIPSIDSTANQTSAGNPTQVNISDDAIDVPILYGARDTQWYEHKNKLMHLFGEAYVNYEEMELKAGYIILNMETNVAEAMSIEDDAGHQEQLPTFFDGNKDLTYNHLKYNFKTKKGIVYDAISTEGDLFLHGATTKFVGADDKDQKDDIIYNKNTLITTCNHEHPHYGFRARKLKVIPDKIAVIGPANLELGGVPTPLWIPYGFFPLVEGKSSGFIFPQDYEYSPQFGFGLRNFGWYFPINDYVDLTLLATLYTRGTHGLNLRSNYKKRYKYVGDVTLGYNNQYTEIAATGEVQSNSRISVEMNHRQEAKAHPYVTVGGGVSFETGNFGQRVYNDAQSVNRNTLGSNFNYKHSMPNSAYSFSLGTRHDQNTRTREFNVTLPDINLLMRQIHPFKRKNRGGNDEAWYEKITFKYDVKMKNLIEATDTTIFTSEAWDNMKTGLSHAMQTGASFKLLKYFTISGNVNYDEIWMLQEIEQQEESESVVDDFEVSSEGDTTFFFRDSAYVTSNTFNSFNTFRTYRANADINTQIFGTKQFSKGWLRGIRHTIKPRVGLAVAPDTRSIYTDTLRTSTSLNEEGYQTYSRFPRQPFSPRLSNQELLVTYGVTNFLELKRFSKKDSSTHKFKIFDRVVLNGNYNIAADSLQWSKINLRSDSRFFKNITNLTFRFEYDPYMEEGVNTRVQRTVRSEQGKLVRLNWAQGKLTNSFSFKQIRELFASDDSSSRDEEEEEEDPLEADPLISPDAPEKDRLEEELSGKSKKEKKEPEKFENQSVFDWLDKLKVVHDISYEYATEDNIGEAEVKIHSLGISGNFDITDNWNIRVQNFAYDFKKGGLNYPAFSLSRKLHCWKMDFSWYPNRNTYTFFIGVNPGSLDFLKYNYGQNNVDGLFSRR